MIRRRLLPIAIAILAALPIFGASADDYKPTPVTISVGQVSALNIKGESLSQCANISYVAIVTPQRKTRIAEDKVLWSYILPVCTSASADQVKTYLSSEFWLAFDAKRANRGFTANNPGVEGVDIFVTLQSAGPGMVFSGNFNVPVGYSLSLSFVAN